MCHSSEYRSPSVVPGKRVLHRRLRPPVADIAETPVTPLRLGGYQPCAGGYYFLPNLSKVGPFGTPSAARSNCRAHSSNAMDAAHDPHGSRQASTTPGRSDYRSMSPQFPVVNSLGTASPRPGTSRRARHPADRGHHRDRSPTAKAPTMTDLMAPGICSINPFIDRQHLNWPAGPTPRSCT